MAIEFIGCRGGDPDAPRLLASEGWRYGARSNYTIYAWPYFIDIKWQDYDWAKHIALIAKWRPVMAMVADYERPEQKALMLSQVSEISALEVRPMVCPKFPGASLDIPDGVVVAVSVPTDYAGFLPDPAEIKGRDIHFLGGHPDQFRILKHDYGRSNLISVDCSAIFQKAQFGAFWSAKGNTWRYIKGRFSTHVLTRMSARTVKRYMSASPRLFIKDRNRLAAVGFRVQPALFEVTQC
jgi:hypothetical protein